MLCLLIRAAHFKNEEYVVSFYQFVRHVLEGGIDSA